MRLLEGSRLRCQGYWLGDIPQKLSFCLVLGRVHAKRVQCTGNPPCLGDNLRPFAGHVVLLAEADSTNPHRQFVGANHGPGHGKRGDRVSSWNVELSLTERRRHS